MAHKILLAVLSLQSVLFAQERMQPTAPPTGNPSPLSAVAPPATESASASNYVLGPDDKVLVSAPDVEEIKQTQVQIDLRGNIDLPLLGTIHAGGTTVEMLTAQIRQMATKYVRDPQISVSISEYRSQSVSVFGSVNNPGITQIQGTKTLFQVISLAGGLRPDAGDTIQITRRMGWGPLPLPNAKTDATGRFSVASVQVKSVLRATDPAENIALKPDDVISVPKADLVYCVGQVRRPGGFALGQNDSLSALQVLALAEGLDKNAAPGKAKILRKVPGSDTRAEIPIDLKRLTAGQTADLALKSDDILFVPNSLAKSATSRTLEAVIQAATGVAIYGRY